MSTQPSTEPSSSDRGPGSRRDQAGRGFLLIFLLNLAQLAIGFGALTTGMANSGFGIGLVILLGFGLVELIYVVPLAVIAYRRGERERMKGIILAGAIPLLLNGACWGAVGLK